MVVTFKVANKTAKIVNILKPSTTDGNHYLNNCSEYSEEKCKEILQESPYDENSQAFSNGFVHAARLAYNEHHNLILKPDDVWLAITTQFSIYVNGNAEELRSKFVSHTGKKEIKVYAPGRLKTANYAEISQQFVSALKKNIVDEKLVDWIIPKFTTTTYTDLIVGSIIFMSSVKKYFELKCCLKCGIPQVTLLGTPEDWEAIHVKVDFLRQYGEVCSQWADMLEVVTSNLWKSALGNPDIKFWQRICHNYGGGSETMYLSGWITAFCVFDGNGKWRGDQLKISLLRETVTSEFPFIEMDGIHPGYATVPITIDDNGTEYKSLMFAGHMTSRCVEKTSIAPQLSWAICLL